MADKAILSEGAVALVTGASAGIGRAVAVALSARGVRVICAARRLDRLDALVSELPHPALALELDIADGAAADSILARLPEDWRQIDILINNAGHDLGGRQPYHERAADDVAAVIQTNVTGMMRTTLAVMPQMRERGRGHIVTIGSVNGVEWVANHSVYVASKFAVHGFTNSLRLELRGTGVRLTEVMPGLVRSEFAAARWGGDEARAEKFYDRFDSALSPEDVADAVLYTLDTPAHVNICDLVLRPA
ncbi:MAG: SDR family NAD(P)-dependent oxidoreductase [Alphaproteobacteria bacterium]|nr:SDR family NAD(P)-dependent oxidoreductase [Alphaproteobacteria bacterium]